MFYLLMVVFLPLIGFVCCVLPFRRTIGRNKSSFIFLGILTLVFLSRFVIGNVAILQKDANLLQVPFFMSYRDSILGYAQLPLWNPYLWSGMPNLAHPLSHSFHPTVFLSLLLPVYQAFNLSIVLAVFFSAAFMFLLLSELGQDRGVALIASIAYAFNEFTLDRIGARSGPGLEYLYSYSLVPLSLVLLLRAFKTGRYYYAILFGLSLAFVMNGNPNLLYHGVLLCLVLLPFAMADPTLKSGVGFKIVALLIGLVVLILADAIELIPFFEFQQNVSESRLLDTVSGWRVAGISWTQLTGLFFPHTKHLNFGYASRVGWGALVLALLSLVRVRRVEDRRVVLAMLGLLIFGTLLLTHSPLFTLTKDYVPFFDRISMVPAVFVFFTVPLSVLAGIGSKILSRRFAVQILLALIVFCEMVAVFNGSFRYTRFREAQTFDYKWEMEDFPHLAALNSERTLRPYRIECRASGYRILCPEYAVMHYRLRMINGDKYLFPTRWVNEMLDREQRTKLFDVRYILSTSECEEPGFNLREKVRWETFDEHREGGFRDHVKESVEEKEWDGIVYIYESTWAAHAFLVDDDFTGQVLPDNPAVFDVTYFSPMRLELEGYAPQSGTLFVSELYYPGWMATVDGADVGITEVGGGFVGIPLNEGVHSVVLYYAPLSFRLGFWITFAVIFLVVALSAFQMRPTSLYFLRALIQLLVN